jgi:hypothetical protein
MVWMGVSGRLRSLRFWEARYDGVLCSCDFLIVSFRLAGKKIAHKVLERTLRKSRMQW